MPKPNNKPDSNLLGEVARYYSAKLAEHGTGAKGVDWNGEQSQELRFHQLCRIITDSEGFSINDFGCGYGALYDYLTPRFNDVTYSGVDISMEMVTSARERIGMNTNVSLEVASEPGRVADYCIASGVFNVRQSIGVPQWLEYIYQGLTVLNQTSQRGFAFNCLTSYSDEEKMRDYLYYADPLVMFDYCKKNFSSQVALLHDYGLYEFTILVRKPV